MYWDEKAVSKLREMKTAEQLKDIDVPRTPLGHR